MSREDVTIVLDRDPPDYRPDEPMSGTWALPAGPGREVRSVELSVLWYTDGKGDEDFGVHHFDRRSAEEGGAVEAGQAARFAARLPRSPLSYDGLILKLCWCVRVRVFWDGGETVAEVPFRLGDVARPESVPTFTSPDAPAR
jgi:hypothetical protein